MAVIRIRFPKTGHEVSTWVHDDDWGSLADTQREALIYRYVKNQYHSLLITAKAQSFPRDEPNYRWSEL